MMKRLAGVVLSVFFIFGFVAASDAQDDVVDKIDIVAVKKISVEEGVLNLSILINNKNAKNLKFIDGDLVFYMGLNRNKGEKLGEQQGYSTDTDYADGIPSSGQSLLNFAIKTGDASQSLKTLAYILNCIGDPANKPFVTIEGEFKLGIQSAKGWTTGNSVGITWNFTAATPDDVNLLTVR